MFVESALQLFAARRNPCYFIFKEVATYVISEIKESASVATYFSFRTSWPIIVKLIQQKAPSVLPPLCLPQ